MHLNVWIIVGLDNDLNLINYIKSDVLQQGSYKKINKINISVVFCLVLGHVVTALIPTPIRYKNLAYSCLFITRIKSYTRFLNREYRLMSCL